MPRYIDADALKQKVGSYNPVKYTFEYGDVITVYDIDHAPTADVVEVVRCKDCLFWRTETEPIGIECNPGETAHDCSLTGITRTNEFCCWGVNESKMLKAFEKKGENRI